MAVYTANTITLQQTLDGSVVNIKLTNSSGSAISNVIVTAIYQAGTEAAPNDYVNSEKFTSLPTGDTIISLSIGDETSFDPAKLFVGLAIHKTS